MRRAMWASAVALLAIAGLPAMSRAQGVAPPGMAKDDSHAASKIPDLSGDWTADGKKGGIGQSLSLSDIQGRKRGAEGDIPYQPWALKQTMSEVPATGDGANFAGTTDPTGKYCAPPGVPKIYMWPAKTKFVQTPDVVYIMYEYGFTFRQVWLNRKHSPDPDPQWWGESVGWYENGDTLVVDTIGFNDKTWLDQMGHPHTEKLHLIERYKRTGDSLDLAMTIDDPGAYTKPWNAHRAFMISKSGIWYQWVCTVDESQGFLDKLLKPADAPKK